MENPTSWNKATLVVYTEILEWEAEQKMPPEDQPVGGSLPYRITTALASAGYLTRGALEIPKACSNVRCPIKKGIKAGVVA